MLSTSYNNAFEATGTTLADSGVARNDLLTSTAYPDATPAWSTLSTGQWANLTVDQWANLGVGADNGTGPNMTRTTRRQLTYPNGRTIAPSYGTSGGMSDYLNRVDAIQDTTSGATTLASYTYLGVGTVVRITLPEPGIWLDLWGGTSGVFAGLDQFRKF
jgi:hypothetical protein